MKHKISVAKCEHFPKEFNFRYFPVNHKAPEPRYFGEVLAISHRDYVLQSCDFFFRGLMKYMVHLNSLAWKTSWKGYLALLMVYIFSVYRIYDPLFLSFFFEYQKIVLFGDFHILNKAFLYLLPESFSIIY